MLWGVGWDGVVELIEVLGPDAKNYFFDSKCMVLAYFWKTAYIPNPVRGVSSYLHIFTVPLLPV